MQKRSPIVLILLIIVAIAAFAIANNAQFNSAPHPDMDEALQKQEQAAMAAKHPPTSRPQMPPHGPMANSGGSASQLITEDVVGDPKTAKFPFTIGFVVDDNLAQHPDGEAAAVGQIADFVEHHPGVSVKIVDLDIPPAMRSAADAGDIPMGLAYKGQVIPAPPLGLVPQGTGMILQRMGTVSARH